MSEEPEIQTPTTGLRFNLLDECTPFRRATSAAGFNPLPFRNPIVFEQANVQTV